MRATPLRGISSMATRAWLAAAVPLWTETSGVPVEIESVGGVEAVRRVREGERFDVVLLADDALATLVAAGLAASPRIPIARSVVVAAVVVGPAVDGPDVSSEEALRTTLCRATRIGLSTGPSGAGMQALFARWGLAEALAGRTLIAPPGVPVARLLRESKVSLGFQQKPELVHEPGIRLLPDLPDEAALMTTFSGANGSGSVRCTEVHALLAFLAASPAGTRTRESFGFEAAC